MKLSKIESDGAKIQKIYKSNSDKKDIDIAQELKEVKELLNQILQKLDEKS